MIANSSKIAQGIDDPATAEAVGQQSDGMHEILKSVGECVYQWDLSRDTMTWSKGAADLFCLSSESAIASNRAFAELMLPTTDHSRIDAIMSSKEVDDGDGVPYRLQYGLCADKLQTGSDIWIEDSGRWFAGQEGVPVRAHGVVRIINERRNFEERLDKLSKYDPLTGLFNRSHLNLCLEQMFEETARTGESAAFLVIGLEHFELINSVYGYESGDAVIVEIAKRLSENLREVDIVGRFSGAKIGVILPECNDRDMLVAGYRVLNLLRENVVITEKGPIAITISIGGVVLPQQARDSRQVFVGAQQALTESRRHRDAAIVSYRQDPKKDAQRLHDALTAERIVTALKHGHIFLAFQPIVDAKTHDIIFHEALVRLHSPDGVEMVAGEFIQVAQRLGLIRLVDHHALDLALQTLSQAPDARFSLNVSYETAADPEWMSKLANAVTSKPDIADRLIIEITESHAAESLDEAGRFVSQLKELGFKVALDDFGAGFTSFRNLKFLPFDIIKIDGQFVENLAESIENQSFIRALVELAQLFNAKTVVEWVENNEVAELLNSWGVDYLQGYEFGKPARQLPWNLQEADKSPQ